jgi:alpha-beta hydrolase superfamily lysophospholipase
MDIPPWNEHVRNIRRAQWMSQGADPKALEHMFKFANREGPTPAAASELAEMVKKKNGMASWQTFGVRPDGRPYSIIMEMGRAQKDVPLPYLIFEATGDNAVKASKREADFLCAAGHCVVEGSHGAVLSIRPVRTVAQLLEKYCELLLTRK